MTSDLRSRYLSERVLTATPAQRVVMLYDRLCLDLVRATDTADPAGRGEHLDHALQIVAELAGSLDAGAGGPAENLSALYGYLIGELVAVRGGRAGRLAGARSIMESLREAWATAVSTAVATGTSPATAGSATTGSPAHDLAAAATGGTWVG